MSDNVASLTKQIATELVGAILAELKKHTASTIEAEAPHPEEFYTRAECARRAGLSLATIDRRIADGTFPKPVKVGRLSRIRRSEFDSWVRKQVAK